MIDLTQEKPVRLTAATKTLSHVIPDGRNGSRINVSTWYRWALRGCRGVKLETVRCGGSMCTTREAVIRFFNSLTNPTATSTPNKAPPGDRRRQIAKANADLAAAGI